MHDNATTAALQALMDNAIERLLAQVTQTPFVECRADKVIAMVVDRLLGAKAFEGYRPILIAQFQLFDRVQDGLPLETIVDVIVLQLLVGQRENDFSVVLQRLKVRRVTVQIDHGEPFAHVIDRPIAQRYAGVVRDQRAIIGVARIQAGTGARG